MGELLELADRCEQATEDEQYDLIFQAAINCFPGGDSSANSTRRDATIDLAANGAFLDAAMTLVPEGWDRIEIGRHENSDLLFAEIQFGSGCMWEGDAATPALALCAASLRAMASKEHGG